MGGQLVKATEMSGRRKEWSRGGRAMCRQTSSGNIGCPEVDRLKSLGAQGDLQGVKAFFFPAGKKDAKVQVAGDGNARCGG
jgi:hypothetical protein